jgi:N-acetylglucosamine-6-phosphate deacetylase
MIAGMQIVNARLILPDEIRSGSLLVRDGKISRIGGPSAAQKKRSDPELDLKGGFLAPGFVDLHVHGALGRDTMEATDDAFRVITEFHLRGGTTSMTLTTMTAPEREILAVLSAAKPWQNRSLGGARVVGVHVEGPFLSKKRAGAQDPKEIRPPQAGEWKRYLAYGKLVTQMTLAPEEPGAIPLIRALRKNGSIASAGHTDALEPKILPAVKAGLNHATHTFNCMSTAMKLGAFRTAGMVEYALAHDGILCELIADGKHVPPTLMKMLYRAKRRDGVCLITDATAGAGMKPGTTFHVGGPDSLEAKVTTEAVVLKDDSGLAGSSLTMIEAVRRASDLAEIPLVEAVRMATLVPARQLGRDNEFGVLAPGRRADLVWFDEAFQVRAVWLDGDVRFLA